MFICKPVKVEGNDLLVPVAYAYLTDDSPKMYTYLDIVESDEVQRLIENDRISISMMMTAGKPFLYFIPKEPQFNKENKRVQNFLIISEPTPLTPELIGVAKINIIKSNAKIIQNAIISACRAEEVSSGNRTTILKRFMGLMRYTVQDINDYNLDLDGVMGSVVNSPEIMEDFVVSLFKAAAKGVDEYLEYMKGSISPLICKPSTIVPDSDLDIEISKYILNNQTVNVADLDDNVDEPMEAPDDTFSLKLLSSKELKNVIARFRTEGSEITDLLNMVMITGEEKPLSMQAHINRLYTPYPNEIARTVNYQNSNVPLTLIKGNVNNNVPEIYENEQGFVDRLNLLYKSFVSDDCNGIPTSKVDELIEKGYRSPDAHLFMTALAISACYKNWYHTNSFPIIKEEKINDDISDSDADNLKNTAGENVDSKYNYQLEPSRKMGDISNLINGIEKMENLFLAAEKQDPFIYSKVIVRLFRWGTRKPSKIYIDTTKEYLDLTTFTTGGSGSYDNLEMYKDYDGSYLKPTNLIYASYKPVGTLDTSKLYSIYGERVVTDMDVPVGIAGTIMYMGKETGEYAEQDAYITLQDAFQAHWDDEPIVKEFTDFLEDTRLYSGDGLKYISPDKEHLRSQYSVTNCVNNALGSVDGSKKIITDEGAKNALMKYELGVNGKNVSYLKGFADLESPKLNLSQYIDTYDGKSIAIMENLIIGDKNKPSVLEDIISAKSVLLYQNIALRLEDLRNKVSTGQIPAIKSIEELNGSVLESIISSSISNVKCEVFCLDTEEDVISMDSAMSDNDGVDIITGDTNQINDIDITNHFGESTDIEEEDTVANISQARSYFKDGQDIKQMLIKEPTDGSLIGYVRGDESKKIKGYLYVTKRGEYILTFSYAVSKEGNVLFMGEATSKYGIKGALPKDKPVFFSDIKKRFNKTVTDLMFTDNLLNSSNLYFLTPDDYTKFVERYATLDNL